MSDAGWIYGAAHVRLAFLRGLRMGTKTSPGLRTARLGLNKSLLITGRPQAGPQPEEQQSLGPVPVSVWALLEAWVSAQQEAQTRRGPSTQTGAPLLSGFEV